MKQLYLFLGVVTFLGAGCVGTTVPTPSPVSDPVPGTNSATRLDLSGQGLEKVPAYVFGMTGLEELDLSDNRLTGALPGEIRHLGHLRVLDVSGNRMTGVPAEIGQLSRLETLDLSDNDLTGLPLELGNLSSLRSLDLRGNDVSRQDLEAIRARLNDAEILFD